MINRDEERRVIEQANASQVEGNKDLNAMACRLLHRLWGEVMESRLSGTPMEYHKADWVNLQSCLIKLGVKV